jgi:alpha-amylase
MADLNGVILQCFQAYTQLDHAYWCAIRDRAAKLADNGFTALWLPAAAELGDRYAETVAMAHQSGLQVYADIVFPHLPEAQSSPAQPHPTRLVAHADVQQRLKHWGEQQFTLAPVDGFRLDANAPLRDTFFGEWLAHLRRQSQRKLFAAGEFWAEDVESLHSFISHTGGQLSLFDVPLHYNFHRASRAGGYFDMRRILFGTLMREQPALAVTFVENHHSQPLQPLESVVEPWFKPLAYALILLRREGYPCVFWGDYTGGHYVDVGGDRQSHEIWLNSHDWLIEKFLYARQHYAHGEQYDYFDHPDCIGWTRLGTPAHPHSMAVILSDGANGSKWMEVGKPHTRYIDLTQHVQYPVVTNAFGWGDFACNGGSVSVWVEGVRP